MSIKKQLIDQAAHTLAAVAILGATVAWPALAPFSAFGIGFAREQGQHGWDISSWGKPVWLDLAAWTLGGLLVAIIA